MMIVLYWVGPFFVTRLIFNIFRVLIPGFILLLSFLCAKIFWALVVVLNIELTVSAAFLSLTIELSLFALFLGRDWYSGSTKDNFGLSLPNSFKLVLIAVVFFLVVFLWGPYVCKSRSMLICLCLKTYYSKLAVSSNYQQSVMFHFYSSFRNCVWKFKRGSFFYSIS